MAKKVVEQISEKGQPPGSGMWEIRKADSTLPLSSVNLSVLRDGRPVGFIQELSFNVSTKEYETPLAVTMYPRGVYIQGLEDSNVIIKTPHDEDIKTIQEWIRIILTTESSENDLTEQQTEERLKALFGLGYTFNVGQDEEELTKMILGKE